MKSFLVCLFVVVVVGLTSSEDANEDGFVAVSEEKRAVPGQFPWQAALFIQSGPHSDFWFCSGSVIGPEWIVTTADCLEKATSALVYTGLLDLSANVSATAFSTEFHTHENYDGRFIVNDIGLVKLSQPLVLDENTQAIALPTRQLGDNIDILMSGWGKNRPTEKSINRNLSYINLKTISNGDCARIHRLDLNATIGCAISMEYDSSLKKGPCDGDSGDPIIVQSGETPELVAFISFIGETGTCNNNIPSGFVRVAYYRDWIKEKTGL